MDDSSRARQPRGLRRAFALSAVLMSLVLLVTASGCEDETQNFDAAAPSRGPGEMVRANAPVSDGNFAGGADALPRPRSGVDLAALGETPDCVGECLSYCASLGLENPVNRGVCPVMWGVGLEPRPIVVHEACRRLFIDVLGRIPTADEVASTCEGRPWGEVVKRLMATEEFVLVNQRRFADLLMYNNQAVSLERIYDLDALVGKMMRGLVSYDQFAAVAASHPVVTRRHDTPSDRADAVFWMFLGRPPLGHERSDMSRLYNVWQNGYYDHEALGTRLPDAFVRFPCVNPETGEVDETRKGECTSILWGYNEVILTPDVRAVTDEQGNRVMWSGLLRPEEWQLLQTPGRILAAQPEFWEKAVDDVLELYLGYRLGVYAPQVRDELVRYFLRYNGDLRALHFAVLTSAPYLQSTVGQGPTAHRWTYGPLKQIDAEPWLDSISRTVGYEMSDCDHRLSRPEDLLELGSVAAMSLLESSRWMIDQRGRLRTDYLELARGIGGCPANDIGSRFKTVSILTTATQVGHIATVCGLRDERRGVAAERLLPPDIAPARQLSVEVARQILEHQTRLFLSRSPTEEELADIPVLLANEGVGNTATTDKTAESFARPICFALLSSAEMLFY